MDSKFDQDKLMVEWEKYKTLEETENIEKLDLLEWLTVKINEFINDGNYKLQLPIIPEEEEEEEDQSCQEDQEEEKEDQEGQEEQDQSCQKDQSCQGDKYQDCQEDQEDQKNQSCQGDQEDQKDQQDDYFGHSLNNEQPIQEETNAANNDITSEVPEWFDNNDEYSQDYDFCAQPTLDDSDEQKAINLHSTEQPSCNNSIKTTTVQSNLDLPPFAQQFADHFIDPFGGWFESGFIYGLDSEKFKQWMNNYYHPAIQTQQKLLFSSSNGCQVKYNFPVFISMPSPSPPPSPPPPPPPPQSSSPSPPPPPPQSSSPSPPPPPPQSSFPSPPPPPSIILPRITTHVALDKRDKCKSQLEQDARCSTSFNCFGRNRRPRRIYRPKKVAVDARKGLPGFPVVSLKQHINDQNDKKQKKSFTYPSTFVPRDFIFPPTFFYFSEQTSCTRQTSDSSIGHHSHLRSSSIPFYQQKKSNRYFSAKHP